MIAARTESGREKRRHKRRSGMWRAAIEMAPGQRFDCVVLDLSDSGAKLLVRDPAFAAAAGERVTFLAERVGRRPARIAWAGSGRAGLEFLDGAKAVRLPPGSAARQAMLDPAFLRGRAKVLRTMAGSGATAEAAARLLAAADGLDQEADAILRRGGE